jgi:hypothetical protein
MVRDFSGISHLFAASDAASGGSLPAGRKACALASFRKISLLMRNSLLPVFIDQKRNRVKKVSFFFSMFVLPL